jgi:hypothetical protein
MSNIRVLSFGEISQVSGGGKESEHDYHRHSGSTNYGGQANGFQPNISAGLTGANMYNDLSSNCGLALVGGSAGLANAAATKSVTGAITSIAGMIAGCRPDSGSKSKNGPPFR